MTRHFQPKHLLSEHYKLALGLLLALFMGSSIAVNVLVPSTIIYVCVVVLAILGTSMLFFHLFAWRYAVSENEKRGEARIRKTHEFDLNFVVLIVATGIFLVICGALLENIYPTLWTLVISQSGGVLAAQIVFVVSFALFFIGLCWTLWTRGRYLGSRVVAVSSKDSHVSETLSMLEKSTNQSESDDSDEEEKK